MQPQKHAQDCVETALGVNCRGRFGARLLTMLLHLEFRYASVASVPEGMLRIGFDLRGLVDFGA